MAFKKYGKKYGRKKNKVSYKYGVRGRSKAKRIKRYGISRGGVRL